MKLYVVSYLDATGESLRELYNGVYGVFDTLPRAIKAVQNYMQDWEETLSDMLYDVNMCRMYTDKGNWIIEGMELNDDGR